MYIKYENGEAEPPVKVVVGLSKLYKVDYEHIIDILFYVLSEDENTLISIVESDLWKNDLWNDVEDAMQMVSASLNDMDLILTRNPKRF